jgi:hypothetical protein
LFFERYTFARVLNLNAHAPIFLMHAYPSGSTSRMTMNVREALLNHPKNCDFHLIRQPAKLIRYVQIDLDFTAFREAVHVPAKRRCETGYIKQWGMQQMRDDANLPANLFYQDGIFRDGSGSRRIEFVRLSLNDRDVQAECREQLPGAVV